MFPVRRSLPRKADPVGTSGLSTVRVSPSGRSRPARCPSDRSRPEGRFRWPLAKPTPPLSGSARSNDPVPLSGSGPTLSGRVSPFQFPFPATSQKVGDSGAYVHPKRCWDFASEEEDSREPQPSELRALSRVSCLVSRVSDLGSRSCQREKPRGSSAFASPSRGSQPKQLAPFRHTSDSGLTLRLRCRLGSFALRFYPSPVVRCRSVRHPRVPCGHRPTLRQFGVTRRDLGGPDGHWHLSPKSATPIRGADRSRSTRRSVRSFAPEVSLRCDGGPESPSSGSLFRPKPSERVGTYGRSAHYVNRIGWSVFARLPDFSRPAGCTELHRCGSCHTGAV